MYGIKSTEEENQGVCLNSSKPYVHSEVPPRGREGAGPMSLQGPHPQPLLVQKLHPTALTSARVLLSREGQPSQKAAMTVALD